MGRIEWQFRALQSRMKRVDPYMKAATIIMPLLAIWAPSTRPTGYLWPRRRVR